MTFTLLFFMSCLNMPVKLIMCLGLLCDGMNVLRLKTVCSMSLSLKKKKKKEKS